MNISDLLKPDAVFASLKVQSKKQLLQELSARAAQQSGIAERKIFETLSMSASAWARPASAPASPSRTAA